MVLRMSLKARLLMLSLSGLLIAAAPQEFTREELRSLESERDAALRQLELAQANKDAARRGKLRVYMYSDSRSTSHFLGRQLPTGVSIQSVTTKLVVTR